jgi:hypothetical protein
MPLSPLPPALPLMSPLPVPPVTPARRTVNHALTLPPTVSIARVMQFVDGAQERPKVLGIYDSGGQDCFLPLHDVLTAPGGTCYMLVFSLVMLQEPLSQAQTIAELETRLNTVAVHAVSAPILLVGTHKDQALGDDSTAVDMAHDLSEVLRVLARRSPAFEWVVPNGGEKYTAPPSPSSSPPRSRDHTLTPHSTLPHANMAAFLFSFCRLMFLRRRKFSRV